jgi:mono/diheme cytochrome c family protein
VIRIDHRILVLLVLGAAGCRQDMHDQPKYIPYRRASFFADQRSERTPAQGTIARGQLREDSLLETGKVGDADAPAFPFEIDSAVMERGQERFNIYCSPCHGRTGDGNGMIVQRGYRHPPSFHIDRLRQAPPGHIFDVITNGFGAMPDYAVEVRVQDRWAIAAYIQALQFSQHAPAASLPAETRTALEQQNAAPAPSGSGR